MTQHTQRIKEVGEEQLKHEQGLDLLVKETKRIKSMVCYVCMWEGEGESG